MIYWLRILTCCNDRYVKLCFDRLGYVNWVTLVRQNLYENSFDYVWEAQFIENQTQFLRE